MPRTQRRRHRAPKCPPATARGQVPLPEQERFARLYHGKRLPEALVLAHEFTRDYPDGSFAWKALGNALLENQRAADAEPALLKAVGLSPEDPELHNSLGKTAHKLGRPEDTIRHLEKALRLKPDFEQAREWLIKFLMDTARYKEALEHLSNALKAQPDNRILLNRRAHALQQSGHFGEALAVYEDILRTYPNDGATLSNIGGVYRSVGRFDEAETAYRKAMALQPDSVRYYSNYLLSLHYNPAHGGDAIRAAHLEWDARFRPEGVVRTQASDRDPGRRLRVGMISAGFRAHPVGQMITSAIEQLPREDIELFAYTMHDQVDVLTGRIRRRTDHWQSVTHLSDGALADTIRTDGIDILLDLCGHTEGHRTQTMAREPAPLQIKWVGGQINTTGLSAMDYMLTDKVETPAGVDEHYVEKLIRLPDDYICFMPRGDAPEVRMLPALGNGYVTFGCFNNPSKLNPVIVEHWGRILNAVPDSRLFLKGNQYSAQELIERISEQFESMGIARERLLFEGHSSHLALLDCYNRVDIALDPWPYSGGLTTCEALLMGVPVVTLPGPTFAGRHSASHLTHVGLPELVAADWEHYTSLAVSLAGDLDNLATIRKGLRSQLKNSPVCDYRRFAGHLNTALRAIWQRYCEGQPPAALTFAQNGQAWFEGEAGAVTVTTTPVGEADTRPAAFDWQLAGPLITIDNGSKLFADAGYDALRQLDAFAVIGLDPQSRIGEDFESGDKAQLFRHSTLGNGEPGTLYACLDPAMTATLPPLPASQLPEYRRHGAQILTELPINTLALDAIEGLESIDWLILDDRADNHAILAHGEKALADTLLLQVRIAFQPSHGNQADFSSVHQWATAHGFRFYRFNDLLHTSHFSPDSGLSTHQATELSSADALFIPADARLSTLEDGRRLKLAFLLHTVFGVRDLSHALLHAIDPSLGERYLEDLGAGAAGPAAPPAAPEPVEGNGTTRVTVPNAPCMSDGEAALFRHSLERATHYFEYGSGGSTVWAVEHGLTVHGVESDRNWVSALKHHLGKQCEVAVVDIGPTGAWGFPASTHCAERFPDYSRAIEEHAMAFDLILVDGRFRVACTMAAIRHSVSRGAAQSVRIFIHDFWNRPQYHVVLEFLESQQQCESAGVFRIKPGISLELVDSVWREYARVPA